MNTQQTTQQPGESLPWETSQDPDVLHARIQELEGDLANKVYEHGGEAGGLAWVKMYTQLGAEITLSARSVNPKEALVELVKGIRFGIETMRLSTEPARPAAPAAPAAHAPAPQDYDAPDNPPADNGTGGETITVEKIVMAYTKGGEAYLKIKGGNYMQFGASAYKESLPPAIKDSITTLFPKPSVDYAPPANLRRCVVFKDDKGRAKVSHFIQ